MFVHKISYDYNDDLLECIIAERQGRKYYFLMWKHTGTNKIQTFLSIRRKINEYKKKLRTEDNKTFLSTLVAHVLLVCDSLLLCL